MSTYSLRRSAIFSIILPMSIAIIICAGGALWSSYQAITSTHDANMMHQANLLLLLTKHEALEGENIDETLSNDVAKIRNLNENRVAYRIWSDTRLITASPNADTITTPEASTGFSLRTIHQRQWIIYTLHNNSTIIEVAEQQTIRTDLLMQIIRSILIPLSLSIPLLTWIISRGIHMAINPILLLSKDVDERHAHELQPLPTRYIPVEIEPLFTALNQLFMRLTSSITREREFTENAAHELRTPLAALKTRAQLLIKRITPYPELKPHAQELVAAIDRTTNVVDQLLSFTRLHEQHACFHPINFSEFIAQATSEIASQAPATPHQIITDISPALTLTGHAGSLTILLRNLIDNAVRYTPPASTIHISLQPTQDDTITLRIADTGAGIDPSDYARIFERFTRIDTSKTGSGLGLAIVKDICDMHHATISLSKNTPQGLIVTIIFPAHRLQS